MLKHVVHIVVTVVQRVYVTFISWQNATSNTFPPSSYQYSNPVQLCAYDNNTYCRCVRLPLWPAPWPSHWHGWHSWPSRSTWSRSPWASRTQGTIGWWSPHAWSIRAWAHWTHSWTSWWVHSRVHWTHPWRSWNKSQKSWLNCITVS